MGDTNQKFKTFWDSKMFGSPIYNSINVPKSDGTVDELKNNVDSELRQAFENRQKLHGFFILYGLSTNPTDGVHFEDIWIFINDLSEEDFNKLNAINNTRSTNGTYQYRDYKDILKGHGRVMAYTSQEMNVSDNFDKNSLFQITECYLDKGLPSKELYYGRIAKENPDGGNSIIVTAGFYSYKSLAYKSVIRGKGIIFKNGKVDQQGLFTYDSYPIASQQIRLVELDGFTANQYADDDKD